MIFGPQRRRRAAQFLMPAGSAALFFMGLVAISVADLFFLGRLEAGEALAAHAALGTSLLFLWALSALVVPTALIPFDGDWTDTDERPKSVGEVFFNRHLVVLALATAIAAAAWKLIPTAFSIISAQPDLWELGIPYTRLRLIGLPLMAIFVAYRGFLDAVDGPVPALCFCLTINVFNVGLNALFMWLAGATTQDSLEAVAMASTIAMAAGVAAMVAWSIRPELRERVRWYSPRHFDWRMCWRISKANPAAAAGGLVLLTGATMTLYVVNLADESARIAAVDSARHAELIIISLTDWETVAPDWPARVLVDDWIRNLALSRPPLYLAGTTVVLAVLSTLLSAAVAVGHFTVARLRKIIAVEDYRGADERCWKDLALTLAIVSLGALPMLLFPSATLRIFTSDPEIIAATAPALRLMAAQLPLAAMATILWFANIGVGQWRFALGVAGVTAATMVPVTNLFALVFSIGFMGIWWGLTVIIAGAAVALAFNFWFGFWKPFDA